MAPDPYASHLPILRKFRPKRVLEFGPGLYSTAYFLSCAQLERLVSIERDPEWLERLQKEFTDDRWELLSGGSPDPKDFDLVLIDDGHTSEDRVKTIRDVLSHEHPRVVIHDAEVGVYQQAIGDAPHVIYKQDCPWTAVVS